MNEDLREGLLTGFWKRISFLLFLSFQERLASGDKADTRIEEGYKPIKLSAVDREMGKMK